MTDLTQTLKEADDLLRIARTAMQKLRLEGLGSDCRLSHEVRMFALEFSRESRDGPGVLQVNGTGRALKCLEALRAALAQQTAQQAEPVQRKPLTEKEIDHAANNIFTDDPVQWWRRLARAIEAAHGIKEAK